MKKSFSERGEKTGTIVDGVKSVKAKAKEGWEKGRRVSLVRWKQQAVEANPD
jgi:hypothetical protein